jgi:hypothetical protein
MMDRTGNTGEPCGVPTLKSKGSNVRLLNLSVTVRSARKELHHRTSPGMKLRLAKTLTSLS